MTEKTFTALFLHILIKPSHVNIILCFPNYMMTRTLLKKYTEHFSVYLCKKKYITNGLELIIAFQHKTNIK